MPKLLRVSGVVSEVWAVKSHTMPPARVIKAKPIIIMTRIRSRCFSVRSFFSGADEGIVGVIFSGVIG